MAKAPTSLQKIWLISILKFPDKFRISRKLKENLKAKLDNISNTVTAVPLLFQEDMP